MKTRILSLAATLGLSAGALAQGAAFGLDDTTIAPGLAVNSPGNYYSGTFGMEVWELNTAAVPAGINLSAAPGSGVLGYNAMVAAGFLKELTYADQTTPGSGDFELGLAVMPGVPAGGTVVVALAVWNTSAPSWNAMLANANQVTRAGILAFDQPTAGYPDGVNPIVYPVLAMNQDLVLSPIPEPSGLAMAGLGGVLLLLFRRRRRCAPGTGSGRL